ncbi:MAG: hypothetical protein JHD16_13535, partial [Solirubrobacteraceae bacterium]|nr:hypothetical protein [Solirubrobacteraceae bacterium]
MPRAFPVLLLAGALLPALTLGACGGDDPAPTSSSPSPTTPTTDGSTTSTDTSLPVPRMVTKNTTRLDAVDPASVAA